VLLYHLRRVLFLDFSQLDHHNPLVSAGYLLTSFGHQSVVVFFVMSGYLVGGSVLRKVDSERWSWKKYLLSRLTRLYVVLLPALLLGGALDRAGTQFVGTQADYARLTLDQKVRADTTLPTMVANCLFLQNIKLPRTGGYSFPVFGSNGPLWSLSNEFWYYMAFPLIALLLDKGRSWQVRAACGSGLLAWGWFVGSDIAFLGIPWLMGVAIARFPPFPLRGRWIRGIAIGVALGLFAAALPVAAMSDQLGWFADALLGPFVAFLIWVILHCATAPLPSIYVKVAQRSARSSYTLYLTHFPLLIFLKAYLHLPRGVPTWHLLLISVGLLAVILSCSQLVYEIFEKHTDGLRRWIKPYVMRERTA
jgi:peptidoglycan/LPS O-acetylase OafA/YrhL